jgi:hypothetical protein
MFVHMFQKYGLRSIFYQEQHNNLIVLHILYLKDDHKVYAAAKVNIIKRTNEYHSYRNKDMDIALHRIYLYYLHRFRV